MPTDSLMSELFNFGFPAAIAVLIFFAYRDQTKAILEAVQNNTKVISEFQALLAKTSNELHEHDGRASNIGDCVDQVSQTVDGINMRTMRIEAKLDAHDKDMRAWAKLPIQRDGEKT